MSGVHVGICKCCGKESIYKYKSFDESFAAICYEWVRALWFLPPGLPAGVVARLQEIRT